MDTGKAALRGDFREAAFRVAHQLIGLVNTKVVDVLLDRITGGAGEGFADVIFGVMEVLRNFVQGQVFQKMGVQVIRDDLLGAGHVFLEVA